jgi:hypothetical protein
MTTLTAGTLTAGQTLTQAFLIELRRFLDAILKAGSSEDATGRYHWGRGL